MAKANAAKPAQPIGFFHMLRDVLVAAINKGQLPPLFAGVIFLVMIIKMPDADVSRLAFEIVQDLKTLHLLGYFLFVVTLIFWYLHAQSMRRIWQLRADAADGGKP